MQCGCIGLLSSALLAGLCRARAASDPSFLTAAVGRRDDSSGREGWEVLWANESSMGVVRVVRMEVNGLLVQYLLSGSTVIGAQFADGEFRGQDLFPVFALLQSMRFLRPAPARALVLGLGVGSVPTSLRKHGVATDVVEISPAVAEAARLHFAYAPSEGGRTVIGDAREVLLGESGWHRDTGSPKYDLVIHDLYSGVDSSALLTSSLFAAVRDSWLEERGLLVVNFLGLSAAAPSGDDGTQKALEFSLAVAATLRSVFRRVRCYREHPLTFRPHSVSNILCLAAQRRWKLRVPPSAADAPEMSPQWLSSRFQRWEVLRRGSEPHVAGIITEDNSHEHRSANMAVAAEVEQIARQEIIPHRRFWEQLAGLAKEGSSQDEL